MPDPDPPPRSRPPLPARLLGIGARGAERVASATGIDDALGTATEEAIVRALESPAVEQAIVRVLESDEAQAALQRTLSSPAVERTAVEVLDSAAHRSRLGPSARLRRGPEADRADRRGARAARCDRLSGRRPAARHRAPDPRPGDEARRRARADLPTADRAPAPAAHAEHRPRHALAGDDHRRRDPQRDLPPGRRATRLRRLRHRRPRRGLGRGARVRPGLVGHLRLGLPAHLLGHRRADARHAPDLDPDRGPRRLGAAGVPRRPSPPRRASSSR